MSLNLSYTNSKAIKVQIIHHPKLNHSQSHGVGIKISNFECSLENGDGDITHSEVEGSNKAEKSAISLIIRTFLTIAGSFSNSALRNSEVS